MGVADGKRYSAYLASLFPRTVDDQCKN